MLQSPCTIVYFQYPRKRKKTKANLNNGKNNNENEKACIHKSKMYPQNGKQFLLSYERH